MKKENKVAFICLYPNGSTAYLYSAYILKNFYKERNYNLVQIDIFNYNIDSFNEQEILKIIEMYNVICMPTYIWNKSILIKLENTVKKKHIIWGGPEISRYFYYQLSDNNDNYLILGEGELPFENIINNIFFEKNINKQINMDSLSDRLKIVSSDLCCNEFYKTYFNSNFPTKLIRHKTVLIETQRGCKYKCSYCNYNKLNKNIRYQPLSNIYEELEYLIKNQVKEIRFIDAVFTSDLVRAKLIIKHIMRLSIKYNHIPVVFIEADIQSIDNDFVELLDVLTKSNKKICNIEKLKKIDVPQVYTSMINNYKSILSIGIQSLNVDSLRACNRFLLKESFIDDFFKRLSICNIAVKVDVMLGLPLETLKSYFFGLDKILLYFRSTDYVLNIHIVKVLENTELFSNVNKYKIKYDENTRNVISTSTMSNNEMNTAKILTALLFRIINSSFRKDFFNLLDIFEHSKTLLTNFYQYLKESGILPKGMLKPECLDDNYWNGKIYSEIKSTDVIQFFKKYERDM